ncbi:MAG: PKD domain-containing protein, partial [Saprospiraceae bacterium]|nr:PKD domain-containing protein [Saprospiraceae bacterium]
MKNFFTYYGMLALLFLATAITSCKKDKAEVIAGFSFAADAADFKKIVFSNTSQNYNSVSWDFGDSSTSSEVSPTHTYAGAGTYTVKLTATGDEGTDVSTQTVVVQDPDAEFFKLVGDVSKTWRLLRVVSPGRWPLEVGPIDRSQVWWAQGRDNDEIAKRPCIMNDEWTFSRDGKKMQYKTNGDFWAEGGVFDPANSCRESTAGNMTGPNGLDLSAFGDGTHTFAITGGTSPKLEVIGLGAFIGLPKIGTDVEVKVPQNSVKYDLIKLSDGAVDTMILEAKYKFGNNTSGNPDAYWRITLVHYDDPSQEPAIPGPKPVAGFTGDINNLTVTFTNTSTGADSYSWNFGDGTTSTETSPSHTYAGAGIYNVVLTATNANGVATSAKEFTLTSGSMVESDLVGGAWKVRNAATSVFVGPSLGSSEWYVVPAAGLNGSASGADDWSCMTNDEFIFTTGGKYEYKTNGDARNDGYMGTPNGCWSDAQVAASGNGAAFGSGIHSFTFTPASASATGRPYIILTNGASGAAFLGF